MLKVFTLTASLIGHIASVPIESLNLNYRNDARRVSSNVAERDSGFGVYSCEDRKSYSITSQTGPYSGAARLAGAQQCVANNAGVRTFPMASLDERC